MLFKRLIRVAINRESRLTAYALSKDAYCRGGVRSLVSLYRDRLFPGAQRLGLSAQGKAPAEASGASGTHALQAADYLQAIRASQDKHPEYFVSGTDARRAPDVGSDVRVIAYYLPQFHPFEVNNRVWGQGFTEWTNASRGLPQYAQHYQPHLPADMGFYDLRLPDTMRQQAAMAKAHGVDAFCFYYYWFDGVRVMDEPLNQLLQDATLELPFCICWANENWTKKWDGLDSEIVLAQNYSKASCLQFIDDVLPILQDERYIRVNGKPMLVIYRPSLIPDVQEVVHLWRERAAAAGLPGLWLVNAQTFGVFEPGAMGFDAACEFPPHKVNGRIDQIPVPEPLWNPDFSGKVWSYTAVASEAKTRERVDYPLYRGVFPSWDNEARRPGNGFSFAGANPIDFGEWLNTSASYARETLPADQRFVFINAWNEWAEGAHLEPDRHFGFAWLDQVARLKQRHTQIATLSYAVQPSRTAFGSTRPVIAVQAHIFYQETWPDIASAIQRIGQPVDVIVTTTPEKLLAVTQLVQQDFPTAEVFAVDNRGRDIRPFMAVLPVLVQRGYQAVLKVHSKKSLHRIDGDTWRRQLLGSLVPSPQGVQALLSAFQRYPSLGLVAPDDNLLSVQRYIGSNHRWCNTLVQEWGDSAAWLQEASPWFPAGSMFWCKPQALLPLLRCASVVNDAFELEQGQIDGTLAHAVERLTGAAALAQGYHLINASLVQQLGADHARTQRNAEQQWQQAWGSSGRRRVVDSPFARPTLAD